MEVADYKIINIDTMQLRNKNTGRRNTWNIGRWTYEIGRPIRISMFDFSDLRLTGFLKKFIDVVNSKIINIVYILWVNRTRKSYEHGNYVWVDGLCLSVDRGIKHYKTC